jgi:hypothetical protein
MSVKFGVDQINSPAPKPYRNFRRAWNVAMLPAFSAFVSGWGIQTPNLESRILLGLTVLTGVINGIDVFLGSEDVIINESKLNTNGN